jgi:hypothetical protein
VSRIASVADLVLIAAGTVLLAFGASFISPAGPWFVSGAVLLGLGIAVLAHNVRSR